MTTAWIAAEEVQSRVSRMKQSVAQAGLDLFVVSAEESILYLTGMAGVRHSDTVLVTEDGFECLTWYRTDLGSLIIRRTKPRQRLMGALVRRVARV